MVGEWELSAAEREHEARVRLYTARVAAGLGVFTGEPAPPPVPLAGLEEEADEDLDWGDWGIVRPPERPAPARPARPVAREPGRVPAFVLF